MPLIGATGIFLQRSMTGTHHTHILYTHSFLHDKSLCSQNGVTLCAGLPSACDVHVSDPGLCLFIHFQNDRSGLYF